MEYLSLGKIVDSFGIDGTVKIYSTTSFASKRYKEGNKVYILNPQDSTLKEVEVVSFRHSGFFDFVKFKEFTTPEEIKEMKGFEIQVIKNQKDLNEGEFFYSDLRGCKVTDENNNVLGIVKEVEEFPSQITKNFIKSVDIADKTIIIYVMEGLLWESLFWLYSQRCLMDF